MQVPERLALIGGSILLASTLVFTLRSQASSILPKIAHPISSIYGHIGNTQKNVDFDGNFQDAQRNGLTTGTWGSSKYYIGKDNDMHVGSGQIDRSLVNMLGEKFSSLRTISFDQETRAPQDSSDLLAESQQGTVISNLTGIHDLDNLDTGQTTNMNGMFANNPHLQDIDVSNLNTNNVDTMSSIFYQDNALSYLDVSHWQISKVKDFQNAFAFDHNLNNLDLSAWHPESVNNLNSTFEEDYMLHSLDLSHFDTSHGVDMDNMVLNTKNGASIVRLGPNTYLPESMGINGYGIWQNQDTQQSLDGNTLTNNSSHAGTWIWQR